MDEVEVWVTKDVLIKRIMTKAQLLGIANTYSFSMLDDEMSKYEKRLVKKSDDDESWGGLYDDNERDVYEYLLPAPQKQK